MGSFSYLLGYLEGTNKACFDGAIIKNPVEILCHAGALMRFWACLYAEVDREMLINGVNTMLRVAVELLLPQDVAGGNVKRLKQGDPPGGADQGL